MKRQIVVLGAGGHARVVLEMLELAGLLPRVRGVLAPDGVGGLELPWLGGDEMLGIFVPEETVLVNGIGSLGVGGARVGLFESGRAGGFGFLSLVHPGAWLSGSAVLGSGVLVMVRGVVQSGAMVGENVLINSGAIVEHDCRLGDHVHVASGAVLCGGVTVGEKTHVGAGAVVRQGVAIGRGVVVGAGAVVVRDVPDGRVVVGCPAREMQR